MQCRIPFSAGILLIAVSIHFLYSRPLTEKERIEALFGRAAEQINAGRYSEAERTYREILSADKTNARAYSNLGLVYAKQKRIDSALKNARKALSLKPDTPEYLANLGFVHIAGSKYEEAEKTLRKAVELDNELFEGFWWLAEVSKHLEKQDLALQYAKRASELEPERYEPHEISAEVYTARQDYEHAVSSYLKAQIKESRKFDLYHKCALAALEMGDKRRAKQQLRKALHLRERDYELRMKLAEIYLQDGEYGDARGEYVYVSEHGPDHLKPEAFFGAGKACMKEEKYERAEMYTAKAVELKGDEKRYRTQLSTIYEKQGKFKEAAEVMSPVEDQTDANEYLTLGVKHEKAGKLEKAAEFYEKGIASDPGKGIFYLKLGLIRARIEDGKEPDERDYTSAMGIYEKAFDNDLHDVPEMPKIAYNLGRLYQQYPEAGSEEASRKALGCYWQAIRKDPLMIKAYFTAAGAYIGTKPWNSTMHIAVWSAVLITLAGLYFVRRRRIKKKLAQQTSGKGDSE